MGTIVDQLEGPDGADVEPIREVRCPICAEPNRTLRYCRHVRWTFDQGGPLDFARFALETSAFVERSGGDCRRIPRGWWEERGDDVTDRVLTHFDAREGYVFGDLAHLDLLARDIWNMFQAQPPGPRPL